jgi:GNAT superfamily N-acetyltransferase
LLCMSIIIKEVLDRKDLKTFINFPYRLYNNHPHYIPPLKFDEESTLSRKKNPAFEYCEARYWLAYKDNRVVGRIAGIHNKAFIEKWKSKYLRFGWIDFEEDENIAIALVGRVEEWARELGMEAVHGPLGFTDLDHEGMLVEGFDQKGTLAALYNYPYYPFIIEKAGYTKHADWVEYRINVPGVMNDKLEKLAEIVQRRLGLSVVKLKKQKDLLPFVPEVFELINSAYSDLYGVVPLTPNQIRYYTRQYFSFIKTDFISLVTDREGKLAAFGITMPSLSEALQKSKGKLFPFGFIHLLKAIRKNDTAELLLVAVRKDLQGKGVNAVLMNETLRSYIKYGIRVAESNHMLEDNKKILSLWEHFDSTLHKRRRSYIKYLHEKQEAT